MKYDITYSSHSVFTLQYHFVQCIKYRHELFVNDSIKLYLKEQIYNISEKYDVDIIELETDKNHFHLLFRSKPTLYLPKYICALKSITSKNIQEKFSFVHKKIWKKHFWSKSYFLATAGEVTLDMLKKYVQNQGK